MYEPKNNRSQFERTAHNDLIIDSYNANPTSMKASLEFFVKIPSTLPKAVILGDMKELGNVSDEEHKKLIRFVLAQNLGKVIFVGSIFTQILKEEKSFGNTNVLVFENIDQLTDELKANPITSHYILLKGSHSIRLDKAVASL